MVSLGSPAADFESAGWVNISSRARQDFYILRWKLAQSHSKQLGKEIVCARSHMFDSIGARRLSPISNAGRTPPQTLTIRYTDLARPFQRGESSFLALYGAKLIKLISSLHVFLKPRIHTKQAESNSFYIKRELNRNRIFGYRWNRVSAGPAPRLRFISVYMKKTMAYFKLWAHYA